MAKKAYIAQTAPVHYSFGDLVYMNYDNRVKAPLERITDICNKVSDIAYYSNSSTDKTDEVISLYNELAVLIPQIEVKNYDLLSSILDILRHFHPGQSLYNSLEYKKVPIDGNYNYRNVFPCLASIYGIKEKYREYYIEQAHIKHAKEIDVLDAKGERLIMSNRFWVEWYNNHEHVSGIEWKNLDTYKDAEYARQCHKPYPWFKEKPYKYYTFKAPKKFKLTEGQQIEVIDIGNFRDLVNTPMGEDNWNRDKNVVYNQDTYYESSETEGFLLKHIGKLNNDMLEVVDIYQLKDKLDKAGTFDMYQKVFRF